MVWRYLEIEPSTIEGWFIYLTPPIQTSNPASLKAEPRQASAGIDANRRWTTFAENEPCGPFTKTRLLQLKGAPPPVASTNL